MKIKENLTKEELIKKIIEKKEFSDLPLFDVEKVLAFFNKSYRTNEEKIKLSRDLLRKMYSVFASDKIFTKKNESNDWFLNKHISTKERVDYYPQIYLRLLKGFEKSNIKVFDLGAGINGLSYKFFPIKVNYLGIEAVGQLVNLMNTYFAKEKIRGLAVHESLFNLDKVKELISSAKEMKVILLFKVLDSLEMLERDYSKKLLLEIVPISDRVVISFATRSLVKKEKFKANRSWLINFISQNFCILDDFELGAERYICFKQK
jgi:hypothetical protein